MTAQLARSAGLPSVQAVWSWLENVPDPEIPVLNIVDLGIVRGVAVTSDNVVVEVAPTYSGCPATEIIEKSIRDTLLARGVGNVVLKRVLAPPWTTAWITVEGREKLRAYGIAPPLHSSSKRMLLDGARTIACPRCGTSATTLVSEFGSTPCKASYKCDDCFEPFEYFKCI